MIKNNQCKVTITSKNLKYYSDRGFECSSGDVLDIDISLIPKMSHNIVIAICEICGKENELPYSKYNFNISRGGFYSCKSCSSKKRKDTNIVKYGVDVIFKREDVKERSKKWMSSDEFKSKSKESIMLKYGVDSYSKTEEFKNLISNLNISNQDSIREKREATCLEKYGYKSILEVPNLKEEGMLKKYGTKYPFLVPEIKEKIQSTNLDKFGHISPFGNREIQEKCINRVMELYGVDNVWKNKDMINSFIERKKELGIYYKDDEIKNKYLKFRKKVVYLTYKNKSKLLEIWDGNDFYTGEYIKNNFNLNFNDHKYPTIDHKVSIFFGYINNIDINELISLDNLCWTTRLNNLRKSKKEIFTFQSELKLMMGN